MSDEKFMIHAYWDSNELPAEPKTIDTILENLGMRLVKSYNENGSDYYAVEYTYE